MTGNSRPFLESGPSSIERRSPRSRIASSPDWLWIFVIVAVVLLVGVGVLMSYLPLQRLDVPDLMRKPIPVQGPASGSTSGLKVALKPEGVR
jgi:hypothetical protein